MVGMWLGECCRQVEAKEVSNSRNKIHQTTYQPLFPPLYLSPKLTCSIIHCVPLFVIDKSSVFPRLPDHRDKHQQGGGCEDVHRKVHGPPVHLNSNPNGGELEPMDGYDFLFCGQVCVFELILEHIRWAFTQVVQVSCSALSATPFCIWDQNQLDTHTINIASM